MSQKCARLHEILKEGKKFDVYSLDDASVEKELKPFGLYVFYEKKETGHGDDRIVRIGISKASLYGRNKTHFHGTKRWSVFRKQIGRAIIVRDDPNDLAKLENAKLKNWNKKDKRAGYIPDLETEEKVTKYLAENCYFKAIPFDDIGRIEELEKKMIATVAQCNACKASKGWLGYNSPQNRIKKCGLWQELHLTGNELSEDDLAEIENHLIKEN